MAILSNNMATATTTTTLQQRHVPQNDFSRILNWQSWIKYIFLKQSIKVSLKILRKIASRNTLSGSLLLVFSIRCKKLYLQAETIALLYYHKNKHLPCMIWVNGRPNRCLQCHYKRAVPELEAYWIDAHDRLTLKRPP